MARLLLVSNRLPVTVKLEGAGVKVSPSSGGLATGLKGPHQQTGGLWIGWPGDVSKMTPGQRATVDAELSTLQCAPVHLTPNEITRYYEGYSNRILWPLFHYLLDRIPQQTRNWDIYKKVNEKFADEVVARYQPGDLIWVHDYQLLLVPGLLRERLPDARIGFFLHIPFPAHEIFRILPHREEVLEGLLGADLIGFHTLSYARHFANSLLGSLGVSAEVDHVHYRGRDIQLGGFPMGIDAVSFSKEAEKPELLPYLEALRGDGSQKLLLGVDRLDYTKGIPRRLLAMERLFERTPSLRGKLKLVQVAVPSREKVDAYEKFRREIDELVGRINGTYGTLQSAPIHYLYQSFPFDQLVAMYRAADVMLVTALRDGMNLVAKEFVASRVDGDGVLVLSEFAGAAAELGEAVLVNPYDVDEIANGITRALAMDEEERRLRMAALRARVAEYDVHRWANSFIDRLKAIPEHRPAASHKPSTASELSSVVAQAVGASKLLLMVDYDGTLVPFTSLPELAQPGAEVRALLLKLSGLRGTQVHIVSGRKREHLDKWLADLPIGLHAEHGLWSRPVDGEWRMVREVPVEWKAQLRPIFAQYSTLLPGSFVEEKTASLAWHYRMSEPEFAAHLSHELYLHITQTFANAPVEVLPGDKVLEVRPHGITKALVAERLLAELPEGAVTLAFGDDRTDEDLFRVLPAEALSVHVGPADSVARYRVPDVASVRRMLEAIGQGR